MSNKLAKSQNGLSVTGKPSSQDLVLARMLDLSAQITRQEIQPGEVRFWQETFKTERPEMLEWAFREYLKTAMFFPKPADIWALIKSKRETVVPNTYVHYDREKTAFEQSTPEFKAMQKQMDDLLKKLMGQTKMEGAK